MQAKMSTPSMLEQFRLDRKQLLYFIISSNLDLVELPQPTSSSLAILNYEIINVNELLKNFSEGVVVDLRYACSPTNVNNKQYVDNDRRLSKPLPAVPVPARPHAPSSPPPNNNLEYQNSANNLNNQNSTLKQSINQTQVDKPIFNRGQQIESPNDPPLFHIPNTDVPKEWGMTLTEEQNTIVSYETFLLCTYINNNNNFETVDSTLWNGAERDANDQRVMDSVRVQLGISKKKHTNILNKLKMGTRSPSITHTIENVGIGIRNSVTYRLLMLKYWLPAPFEKAQTYLEWMERQLIAILLCLKSTIESNSASIPNNFQELFSNLRVVMYSLIKMVSDDDGSRYNEPEFRFYIDQIESIVNQIVSSVHVNLWNLSYCYPLNTQIYERLIMACFESEEKNTMALLDNHENIIQILESVREKMGLSNYSHSVSFVKCLLHFYQLSGDQQCLQKMNSEMEILNKNYNKIDGVDLIYLKFTLKDVSSWLKTSLSDYHRYYGIKGPKDIPQAVNLYIISKQLWELLGLNNSSNSVPIESSLSALISSSITVHYERFSSSKRPLTLSSFVKLIEEIEDEIKDELTLFTPAFSSWHSNPGSVALLKYCQCYSADVNEVFSGVCSLSQPVVDLVAHMLYFEKIILDTSLIGKENLPRLVNIYSLLVANWINEQETKLRSWIDNAVKIDNWVPIDTSNVKHSSSVVDLFSMLNQIAPFVFSLNLIDVTEFFISTSLGLFNSILENYAESIVQGCGAANRPLLIPSSANEYASNKLIRIRGPSPSSKNPIPMPPEMVFSRVASQKLENLIVRMNNVQFATVQLRDFIIGIQSNCNKGIKFPLEKVNSIFNGAKQRFEACLLTIMRYAATKIIFVDIRSVFIEDLYYPNPSASRIEKPLEKLNDIMMRVVEYIHEEIKEQFLNEILHAACDGMLYVLMYSGPSRIYAPKDADIFSEDLQLLQNFFVGKTSEGEVAGISEAAVKEVTLILRSFIDSLFSYSSEYLISQYSSAGALCDPKTPFTKPYIMCVLLHRGTKDKEAKAFLKKHKEDIIFLNVRKGRDPILLHNRLK